MSLKLTGSKTFLQCDYWNWGTSKIIQSQRFLKTKDSQLFPNEQITFINLRAVSWEVR